MVTQCCQCRRVRKDDRWGSPEEFVFLDEPVSHGYCPPCAAQLMREITARNRDSNRALVPAPD